MNYLNLVQKSLRTTFSPPDHASSSQIRLYGLGAWIIGFLIVVALCWAIPVLERLIININLGIIYACISIVAFGLMTTGCFRALTGKKMSGKTDDQAVSFTRVIMGLVSFLLSITIPISIMLLFLYFLQWIGIEPNTLFK